MNFKHFSAMLWLRWRIRINQLRRGGIESAIILGIFAVGAVLLAGLLFAGFFLIGYKALQQVSPMVLMFVFDGIALAVLFFLALGLLIELQRPEVLSLEKFLHLPVSISNAFTINYLSSLLSINMLLIMPPMLAICLGLIVSRGPLMTLLIPLAASFLFMTTALIYQFQGWLASLMVNKRRRRTIIVLVTGGFILLMQAPNLLNVMNVQNNGARMMKEVEETQKRNLALTNDLNANRITRAQYDEAMKKLQEESQARRAEQEQNLEAKIEQIAGIANLVFPPGWLALGARGLAEENPVPALGHARVELDRNAQSLASLSHHASDLHRPVQLEQESRRRGSVRAVSPQSKRTSARYRRAGFRLQRR